MSYFRVDVLFCLSDLYVFLLLLFVIVVAIVCSVCLLYVDFSLCFRLIRFAHSAWMDLYCSWSAHTLANVVPNLEMRALNCSAQSMVFSLLVRCQVTRLSVEMMHSTHSSPRPALNVRRLGANCDWRGPKKPLPSQRWSRFHDSFCCVRIEQQIVLLCCVNL